MNVAANSEIRELTADELDEVTGAGAVALGLFTDASIVSGAIIVGAVKNAAQYYREFSCFRVSVKTTG